MLDDDILDELDIDVEYPMELLVGDFERSLEFDREYLSQYVENNDL